MSAATRPRRRQWYRRPWCCGAPVSFVVGVAAAKGCVKEGSAVQVRGGPPVEGPPLEGHDAQGRVYGVAVAVAVGVRETPWQQETA